MYVEENSIRKNMNDPYSKRFDFLFISSPLLNETEYPNNNPPKIFNNPNNGSTILAIHIPVINRMKANIGWKIIFLITSFTPFLNNVSCFFVYPFIISKAKDNRIVY